MSIAQKYIDKIVDLLSHVNKFKRKACYKFIIKSSYSIFKANQSDGLIINVNTKTDTTIDDIINQDKDKDKDTGLN